jgi:hypothetical protein
MELSDNAANDVIAGNAENGESRGATENVVASFEEARYVNALVSATRPFPALSFPAFPAFPAF